MGQHTQLSYQVKLSYALIQITGMPYIKRLSISREDVIKKCRQLHFDPAEYLIQVANTGYLGKDIKGKGKEKAGVRERIKAAETLFKAIIPQQKAIEVNTNERKELVVTVKEFKYLGSDKAKDQINEGTGKIIDVKIDDFDKSAGDAASTRRLENSGNS